MKIDSVSVRGIAIGAGVPKVCVPVVERKAEDIIDRARAVVAQKPDCIELRIDWFEDVADGEKVLQLLKRVRNMIGDTVLLFTFRSRREGGEADISVEQYRDMCSKACASGYIDLLDVEAYMAEGLLSDMCRMAHENNVYVVASNHDFNKTPLALDIVERLEYMDKMGADIPKIAVMPNCERDVLNLLSATVAYREQGGTKPVITMSMSGLGGITRLSGEIFGSALTFAAFGQSSAPGQFPLTDVKNMLKVIHDSL